MPSYIGHTACGYELLKHLNLSKKEEEKFIIGNLVPDIKQVDIDYTLDEFVNKRNIQKKKRVTHFRKDTNKILEYPHCRIFLEKYESEVQKYVETMAYFFHLYTDFCYFKYFLPEMISFYDSDYHEVDEKDNFYYVKIHKSDAFLKASTFFSKIKKESLYKEYTRSNSYLIQKYKIKLDTDALREFIKKNSFDCHVDEIDLSKIDDVFRRIDKVYNNKIQEKGLIIFDEEKIDLFIQKVVKTFLEQYGYLLEKYQ